MPRQRSRPRRSRLRRFTLVIPHPERRNSELRIRIPSPKRCSRRRPVRSPSYCGSRRRVPQGYTRRGTRYECLKKGFGAGVCSIFR